MREGSRRERRGETYIHTGGTKAAGRRGKEEKCRQKKEERKEGRMT